MCLKGRKNDTAPLSNQDDLGYFAWKKLSFFQYLLLWSKTEAPLIPTIIKFMIEMGDDLFFTSSVFDQMQPPVYPKRFTWVAIYTVIFQSVAYRCLHNGISVVLSITTRKFLEEAKYNIKCHVAEASNTTSKNL